MFCGQGGVGCCHRFLGQGPAGPHEQSWDRDPLGWCFVPQATEDQIKLLRLQRHLQEDFDKPYLDLSLHDTVSNLILDGHHKRAEQLYREFKIPDKRSVPGWWWGSSVQPWGLTQGRSCAVGLGSGGCGVLAARGAGLTCVPRYWWLKISALANRGDWEEMEKFSKSKKSPIGYLVRDFPARGWGGGSPALWVAVELGHAVEQPEKAGVGQGGPGGPSSQLPPPSHPIPLCFSLSWRSR